MALGEEEGEFLHQSSEDFIECFLCDFSSRFVIDHSELSHRLGIL